MVHFIHLSLALVPCHAFGCGFVVHGVHIVFHSVNCIVREKKVNWIVACGWIMIIIAIVGQYWIGGEVAIASRRYVFVSASCFLSRQMTVGCVFRVNLVNIDGHLQCMLFGRKI